jgi:hypothetical protein
MVLHDRSRRQYTLIFDYTRTMSSCHLSLADYENEIGDPAAPTPRTFQRNEPIENGDREVTLGGAY